jgi:ATP-binding cassette subfamily B protein
MLHLRGPLPDERPAGSAEAEPLRLLTVHGLTYRHPGGGRGVEGIDLRLPRGTLTVVTGRVGAGKTTLLRALLGLVPAEAGEIRWNGALVADPAALLVPPRATYTAQAPRLFGETLRANMLLGVPDDPARVADAVHGAMLERDVAAFPRGLETVVGTRGVTLSGGQVQRVAVARMLVREAGLMVIDDVSSALDPETERALWRNLRGRGVTCLAVSHRRAALSQADQVVVLKEGRSTRAGHLGHLLATDVEMAALWEETDDAVTGDGLAGRMEGGDGALLLADQLGVPGDERAGEATGHGRVGGVNAAEAEAGGEAGRLAGEAILDREQR